MPMRIDSIAETVTALWLRGRKSYIYILPL
jgi:hypothetical protein